MTDLDRAMGFTSIPKQTNVFPFYKKAGNARWRLLAYRSYSCIQTTQNGEVDFAQFPMV